MRLTCVSGVWSSGDGRQVMTSLGYHSLQFLCFSAILSNEERKDDLSVDVRVREGPRGSSLRVWCSIFVGLVNIDA